MRKFENIDRVSQSFFPEIRMIQKNGVVVGKYIVDELVLFSADFKVLYALKGWLDVCRAHLCLYFATPLEHMEESCSDLKFFGAPGGDF